MRNSQTLLDRALESYFGLEYIKRGNLSNALFTTIKNVKTDFVFDYGKRSEAIQAAGNIRLYPFEENIAMKLNAICGRDRKRDFYDLYFILNAFTITEITSFFTRKFSEEKLMVLYKSITYFEDAENDEEPVLLKEKAPWDTIKKTIIKKMKTIR